MKEHVTHHDDCGCLSERYECERSHHAITKQSLKMSEQANDELESEIKRYRKALEKIASFDEGQEVTSSFDEPSLASIARKALKGGKP